VLAYLDALIAAIAAENPAEISRLLAHPLARILTRDARVEAEHIAAGAAGVAVAAPLRLLQLRHQTAHLLGEHAEHADAAERDVEAMPIPQPTNRADPRAAARHQMELPLSA
jgi:hypothetical protein